MVSNPTFRVLGKFTRWRNTIMHCRLTHSEFSSLRSTSEKNECHKWLIIPVSVNVDHQSIEFS